MTTRRDAMEPVGGGAQGVSVIVPALDAAQYLPRLLLSIERQTLPPAEVVIVDTGSDGSSEELLKHWRGEVPVVYRRIGSAFPGAARNVGAQLAHHPWLAFLDCRTFPEPHWLEQSAALAAREGAQFVGALLHCRAEGRFKEDLQAATYGRVGVRALPGSLIHKGAFQTCGGFLEQVRAGEDIEWLRRVRECGVRVARVETPVLGYEGFPDTLRGAMAKWYGYTLSNARIDILNSQKIVYSALSFLVCLIFVYRWNDLFAHWKEESIYYIPNITKIFLALLTVCYLVHRGVLRPLTRGVPARFLLPWRWLEVSLVGLCLDIAKTPGMILGASILIRKRVKVLTATRSAGNA